MKTFVVLGMHRSATSLVAGGLKKFGIDMGGNLYMGNPSNPKGHWENRGFLGLNKKILRQAGGGWANPPSREKILALKNKFAPEINRLVKHSEAPLWGWKDPRTTLTIELYLPYLKNPHFICCFRNPLEVAKSLQLRNRFPIEKGLKLARIYNERLLEFISRFILRSKE